MPDVIELEVATPERELVRESVESVQLPGKNGYMGVLPGHAPLIGQLGTGFLSYAAAGRKRYLAVSGGFIEVLPGQVRVLADIAERAEEIDIDRAREELARAQEGLSNPDADAAEATAAVERADARLRAAEQRG